MPCVNINYDMTGQAVLLNRRYKIKYHAPDYRCFSQLLVGTNVSLASIESAMMKRYAISPSACRNLPATQYIITSIIITITMAMARLP